MHSPSSDSCHDESSYRLTNTDSQTSCKAAYQRHIFRTEEIVREQHGQSEMGLQRNAHNHGSYRPQDEVAFTRSYE